MKNNSTPASPFDWRKSSEANRKAYPGKPTNKKANGTAKREQNKLRDIEIGYGNSRNEQQKKLS